ncbi:MAG TPA: hypothetical protein VN604_08220, partial [Nitrospirota bacterium]|nr:hypothetical protein [Nitrospirota bacterium]
YARRLIYDSIDWLDDNEMNYSVGNTLDTLCPGPAYCTGAIKYLLVGEALPSQPFLATERP